MPTSAAEQISSLEQKVKTTALPQELAARVLSRLDRLAKNAQSAAIFDDIEHVGTYVDWITGLPWDKRSEDILDLEKAKQVLDRNHYGLADIKDRILESMAVMKLNREVVPAFAPPSPKWLRRPSEASAGKQVHAPILCFVGLVGTGKTTIAYSVAEALGRKIARIPFGGMGSPLDLRGQSRVHPEAEPGQVVKALAKVEVKNPVFLLDEIDRVADEARSGVMGVLIELLDPEQNHAFTDYYIDYPFDLSEALFITTANNTTNISIAVLDRLEVISMPSYTDEEKIVIGKKYMLPKVVEESGLPREVVSFDDGVWPVIVRPLGYDAGMRTLERTIEGIVRKIAKEYVEGKIKQVSITPENVKQYLPV